MVMYVLQVMGSVCSSFGPKLCYKYGKGKSSMCTIPGRLLDLISNYEKVRSKIDLRLRYVHESFVEN
jgi:hypothetical protein